MQIFSFAAFLLILIALSVKFDKKILEVLPASLCLQILLLYILAFFKALSFIDAIGALTLLSGFIVLLRLTPEKRKLLSGKVTGKLSDASLWVFVLMMILVYFGAKDKLITWWDDLNFWGTDVKAIFYDNGFAGRYLNVAPEFGDYPPGTQLSKWMFLHLAPSGFNEGLMFTGYYFFIYSFLAPMICFFDKKGIKGIAGTMLAGIIIFILPSCVEAFYLDGCCADICMAVAFGAFLAGVVMPSPSDFFNMIKGTLYLAVMVLCKNTSLIWLAYAFVFFVVYSLVHDDTARGKNAWKTIFGYFALPCSAYLSWAIFCLINKRVARSTVGALKYVTTGVDMPDMGHELIVSYIKAFFAWPLHRYENAVINLSPFAFLMIVTALFICMGILKKVSKKECIFFSVFAFTGGVIFYGINLICHLTIFSTEMQYLDPFAMVSSIERYSAPFSFGMIMVLLHLAFGKGYDLKRCIIVALAIVLCADLHSVARGFVTYRADIPQVIEERNMLVGDDIMSLWNRSVLLSDNNALLENAEPADKGHNAHYDGSRILYVRDSSDVSWISHAYISYFMSPISVVYDYDDLESTSIDQLRIRADELHAGYIYVGGTLYEN